MSVLRVQQVAGIEVRPTNFICEDTRRHPSFRYSCLLADPENRFSYEDVRVFAEAIARVVAGRAGDCNSRTGTQAKDWNGSGLSPEREGQDSGLRYCLVFLERACRRHPVGRIQEATESLTTPSKTSSSASTNSATSSRLFFRSPGHIRIPLKALRNCRVGTLFIVSMHA